MSLGWLEDLDLELVPQIVPFYPYTTPEGPTFLDTEACVCALQQPPADNADSDMIWQCIGNRTLGMYDTTAGKWFRVDGERSSDNSSKPIRDQSQPPSTSEPLVWDETSSSFVAYDSSTEGRLTIFEQACTANNNSVFSTAFYRASDAIANDELPVDALPCWVPGAFPLPIQDVDMWQDQGCNEGFWCPNNTVNSLPQYCPPIPQCQAARVAGYVCVDPASGTNIGMGPFEPVICQQGYYCPSPGREMLRCPKGSYCQPGTSEPTECYTGSLCPEGASYQTYLVPAVLIGFWNIMILLGILIVTLRHRKKRRAKDPPSPGFWEKRRKKTKTAKYEPLDDDLELLVRKDRLQPETPETDQFDGSTVRLRTGGNRPLSTFEDDKRTNMQLENLANSMRRVTGDDNIGLSFGYSDLGFHPRRKAKPILSNITGSIQAGSLVAVMGGSGAGKSTFINVLMGKVTGTTGKVTVNGASAKMKRFRKLIGYVPQDDIVLPEFTVFENIFHSARVRLPKTWSRAETTAHVDAVIDCLELSHVRDSLVGTVAKPVISGGQRKRVSIGMELAASPMAIFLDEPTSGLDATAAASVMRLLKALARVGLSVVVIIHQPRPEIFDLLDDLVLLGNGAVIYQGAARQVDDFFATQGFHFPQESNPADVLTDIITGNGRPYNSAGDISKEALIAYWAKYSKTANLSDRPVSAATIPRTLPQKEYSLKALQKQRGAPFVKQFWYCLRRAFVQQGRNKSSFWFEMGLATLSGLLLGLAQNPMHGILFRGFYKTPYEILSVAIDYKSVPTMALLTTVAAGLISAAPGVKLFSEEMLVYRREAQAGHSRLAYFLAKILSVLPRMMLACLHFTTPLVLLASPIISWVSIWYSNMLYFYCIYGLASCVSMISPRQDAPLFATMLSLIVAILCGASPPLSSAKTWHMEWFWRSTPSVWLGEVYFVEMVKPYEYLYNIEQAANETGFGLGGVARNIWILFGIGSIYRVLAFIGLLFCERLRL